MCFQKLNFFLTSSVTYCCLASMNLTWFLKVSLVDDGSAILLWSEKIFQFLWFAKICSVAFNIWHIQKKMLCTENVYPASHYMECSRNVCQSISTISCFSCLVCVDESRVLKFLTTSGACFLNLGAPTSSMYTFTVFYYLLYIIFLCMCGHMCVPQCVCRGQPTACRSWFSPSPCGSWGLSSGHQVWQ